VTLRVVEEARASLSERLRARRVEIGNAVFTRVSSIMDPVALADPEYAESLRLAIAAAVDYGLEVLGQGRRQPPEVPARLLEQARFAARKGIALDAVLRRYFTGYSLLHELLLAEAEEIGVAQLATVNQLLRGQGAFFDRLLSVVSEEYCQELGRQLGSARERRAELVQRLLAGELIEAPDLAYEMECSHLGLVAKGDGAEDLIRAFARSLDRRLLMVDGGDVLWAWLGGRRSVDAAKLRLLVSQWSSRGVVAAIGAQAQGLTGWRLTHQQAKAAFPVALRRADGIVLYSEVALLASVLRDDLVATSLRHLYLSPLAPERDGGRVAKETLRAYFRAGRNVSSAAAALGVSRQTVGSRLRAIEERIGRPIELAGPALEVAIELEGDPAAEDRSPQRKPQQKMQIADRSLPP
jgi:hypothetical protein